jgi:hypothetical protein
MNSRLLFSTQSENTLSVNEKNLNSQMNHQFSALERSRNPK